MKINQKQQGEYQIAIFSSLRVHIPENWNASSAASEQRSAPNRMNYYTILRMAVSYPVRSFPDGMSGCHPTDDRVSVSSVCE